MNITDYLEKFGRAIFEAPLATSARPDEPPELAEIRLAVLDRIREKSYRSGGRKVFPFDLLRVQLRGMEESRCGIFTGQFFRRYLEQEVRNALREAGCRYPETLRVDVEAIAGLPLRDEKWLIVEAASQEYGESPFRAWRIMIREQRNNVKKASMRCSIRNNGFCLPVARSFTKT